jgi:hypothetical protein
MKDQETDPLSHLIARVRADLGAMKDDVSVEKADAHAAISSLKLLERLIIMLVQEAIDLVNSASTTLDSFSLTEDKLTTDATALIAAYQAALQAAGGTLTPEQEAVVNRGKASLAALVTMGENADALVTKIDDALPKPAPAGAAVAAKK